MSNTLQNRIDEYLGQSLQQESYEHARQLDVVGEILKANQ